MHQKQPKTETRQSARVFNAATSDDCAWERSFASFTKLLLLAGPLILSQMGVMIMQVVDAIFLARYSEAAIAAVGPAGFTFWIICGFFTGVVGYTNVFVAQYVGARQFHKVGTILWQGIYLSVAAALVLLAISPAADSLFLFMGHAEDVCRDEIIYFKILCWGGLSILLSSSISGFYVGRNDNLTLMLAHLTGIAINAIFAYCLIFGRCGLPEMGMAGAGWALVIGHMVQIVILGGLLFLKRFRQQFATWSGKAFSPALALRLAGYGVSNGTRLVLEVALWAVFLVLVGRLGTDGLAASNIVFRINGLAFFPVIGLSMAVAMRVGQAQGAQRPDLSRKTTWRGLIMGEIWMVAIAGVMLFYPKLLLQPFFDGTTPHADQIYSLSMILLRYVAAYSLVDNVNIIFMAVLAGAGDTRWLLLASGSMHAGLVLILILMVYLGAGLYPLWLAITVFIFALAVVWCIRYFSGAWERKRVIAATPTEEIQLGAAL